MHTVCFYVKICRRGGKMNNVDTNLYPEYNFRFNGVKDTFDKYDIAKDSNGNTVVVDRTGGWHIGDELIID